MKVKDLPAKVKEAVLEYDWAAEDEITSQEALELWSQWEIGDSYWASKMIEFLDEMRMTEEIDRMAEVAEFDSAYEL